MPDGINTICLFVGFKNKNTSKQPSKTELHHHLQQRHKHDTKRWNRMEMHKQPAPQQNIGEIILNRLHRIVGSWTSSMIAMNVGVILPLRMVPFASALYWAVLFGKQQQGNEPSVKGFWALIKQLPKAVINFGSKETVKWWLTCEVCFYVYYKIQTIRLQARTRTPMPSIPERVEICRKCFES